jgi:hypothetical protein
MNLPGLRLPLKVLCTGYLIVAGVGLAMSGAQILLTHGMADGHFGLSVDDIVYSYYGNRGNSRLEAKLNGTMKDKASTEVRVDIIRWVRQGSPETEWNSKISQHFATNCMKCHGAIPGLPRFTNYEEVKPVAQIDEGASVSSLTRVSHIHLFGIAFIFFFICLIFSLAIGLPSWLKALAIGFPFAFLVVDILSWWMTKWYPGFAWFTIIGGVGYNLSAIFMLGTSLFQMWVMPRGGRTFDENPWT